MGAAHGVGRATACRAGPLHALLGHALLALPLADCRPRIPAHEVLDEASTFTASHRQRLDGWVPGNDFKIEAANL